MNRGMQRDPDTGRMVAESVEDRLAASIEKTESCWIFVGYCGKGRAKYGWLSGVGERKAHRVALTLKLGRPIAEGLQALHTCDNQRCVNPDHLYEGTEDQNHQDARDRDRNRLKGAHRDRNGMRTHVGLSRGQKNSQARLSEDLVRSIRDRAVQETHQSIADDIGVDRVTITNVVNRRTWKHVD